MHMNMVDKLLKADIANKLANKPTKKVKDGTPE